MDRDSGRGERRRHGRHARVDETAGRRWRLLTGHIVVGLVSLLVLGMTGYGWATYQNLAESVHRSPGQLAGIAASLDGDTNILIMGLDSRLDENGNPLPQGIYDALHAGGAADGGQNANVLMLLHVPANGGAATAISIPRDDYVALPGCPDGQCKGKIKQAYGLAFDQEGKLLASQGVPDSPAREQQKRDAGRAAEIATVEQFLGGVPIDHFVEITLVAFFEIAQVVQPITVCLLAATHDSYSGASFAAGRQAIDASQALAFVRQRRDDQRSDTYYNNFTDLDRERRQQAFIASLAYQLKQAGTFTNPSKMSDILRVASQNIAVDSGLDLLTFASQAASLTSGNITFYTLPVDHFGTNSGGESVNFVDLPLIQRTVHTLLYGDSSAPSTATSTGPEGGTTPAGPTPETANAPSTITPSTTTPSTTMPTATTSGETTSGETTSITPVPGANGPAGSPGPAPTDLSELPGGGIPCVK
ncbi:MAG TPA: LCP family protein [Pseudonocardiaceae bacterium]